MAVTVENTTISALNAEQTLTANSATSTGAGKAEVFTFTPTKSGGKIALIFSSASTGTAPMTYSIAAGDLWAGKAIAGTIGSTASATAMEVLEFETAKVLQDDGTIAVTLTPGSTSIDLKTEHVAKLYALELL